MGSLVVALRAGRDVDASGRRALAEHVTTWWSRQAARRLPTSAVTVLAADHDQRPIRGGDDPAVAPLVDVVVIAVGVIDPTGPTTDGERRSWATAIADADAWGASQVGAWHGRAFVRIGDLVGGPLGSPAAGVEQVSLMARAPALDHDAFVEHWTERHTPLARRHHVGLSRYVQHVVDGRVELGEGSGGRGSGGGAAGGPSAAWPDHDVDGVAELQFATEADFAERFFDSDEGAAAIMADVDRFLDLTRTRGALMTPTVVAAG